VIDDLIDLLERLPKGLSGSERESLRAQLLRLITVPVSDANLYAPAQVGTDSDKLDGQHGSYYQNADNITAGTMNTDRFSAYGDLTAESKIGTGALQVAVGNHNHGGTVSGNFVDYFGGALAVVSGVARFVAAYSGTISAVYIAEDDNGSANSTIVDVHKNGTTIFTTQANRPSIANDDADSVASGTPDVTSFVAGDVFTIDIDAIATGASGLGIAIAMTYIYTSTPEPSTYIFTVEGDLAVATGKIRIYNLTGVDKTITQAFGSVSNAPTGAAILADVNIDGTTIFTTQSNRLSIAAGANTGTTTTIENATWAAGSYLALDIDQIGSTTPGYNLTVHVVTL